MALSQVQVAREAAPERSPIAQRRHFPVFAMAWLAVTGTIAMLLNGAAGVLNADFQSTIGFVPAVGTAEPWKIPLALGAMLFSTDMVQYAYVIAIFAIAVPYFESRHGWKQTAYVFFLGGMGAVLVGTLLAFLPIQLAWPDHEVVVHSMNRPYMGASTAVFAVFGALAAAATTARNRWLILGAAVAWETYVWFGFFQFQELISLYHYAAVGVGYALVKSPWFSKLA